MWYHRQAGIVCKSFNKQTSTPNGVISKRKIDKDGWGFNLFSRSHIRRVKSARLFDLLEKLCLFGFTGVLSVLYLIIFVITKSVNWGINLNFSDETVYFTKIYDGTFAATSGMLPLSLFIHNIIITLMRSSRDQYHYVSCSIYNFNRRYIFCF